MTPTDRAFLAGWLGAIALLVIVVTLLRLHPATTIDLLALAASR